MTGRPQEAQVSVMIRGIDRFLAAILVAVFVIIVAAVVLVWRSPTGIALEYSAGGNPEDVVHNYIVAVTKGDVERAKSYLSAEVLEEIEDRDDDGYYYSPLRARSRSGRDGMRVVIEAEAVEDGLATVNVYITWISSGPSAFGLFSIFEANQYTNEHQVRLRQFDGAWQIVRPFDHYMLG